MATIDYKCDTCKRELTLTENAQGMTVFAKCIITEGCKGTLYKTARSENITRNVNDFPPAVSGLNDYVQRRAFYQDLINITANPWKINHNLGVSPAVTVYLFDNNDQPVELAPNNYVVSIVDKDNIEILFNDGPQRGIVHLVARSSVPRDVNTIPDQASLFQVSRDGWMDFASVSVIDTDVGLRFLTGDDLDLEITLQIPSSESVTVSGENRYLEDQLNSGSPWLGWDQVLLRKRRNFSTKNMLITQPFADAFGSEGILSLADIPDGSSFQINQIRYRETSSGYVSEYMPIEPRSLVLLLANEPFSLVDKIRDQIIDVGELALSDNGRFFVFGGEVFIDSSNIERIYPRLEEASVDNLLSTPTPTPSPTFGLSPTPTMTPSVTPTISVSATPSATPPVTPGGTPAATPDSTPPVTPGGTPASTPDSTPDSTPASTPPGTPPGTPPVTPDSTPPVTPGGTPPVTPPGTPPGTPPVTPDSTPPGTPASTPPGTPPNTPDSTPPNTPDSTPPGTPPVTPAMTPTPSDAGNLRTGLTDAPASYGYSVATSTSGSTSHNNAGTYITGTFRGYTITRLSMETLGGVERITFEIDSEGDVLPSNFLGQISINDGNGGSTTVLTEGAAASFTNGTFFTEWYWNVTVGTIVSFDQFFNYDVTITDGPGDVSLPTILPFAGLSLINTTLWPNGDPPVDSGIVFMGFNDGQASPPFDWQGSYRRASPAFDTPVADWWEWPDQYPDITTAPLSVYQSFYIYFKEVSNVGAPNIQGLSTPYDTWTNLAATPNITLEDTGTVLGKERVFDIWMVYSPSSTPVGDPSVSAPAGTVYIGRGEARIVQTGGPAPP